MLQKIERFGRAFFYFGLAVVVWMIVFWGISAYRQVPYHIEHKALTFWRDTFSSLGR